MKYLVYRVMFPNSKCYIGITSKSLEFRKNKHFSELKKGTNYKFHNALRKYRKQEIWEEFCYCKTWNDAKNLEKYFIQYFDSFNNGYNSTLGGDGIIGLKFSEESKKKMRGPRPQTSKALKGKPKSEEHRKKLSDFRKQFKYTREQKEQHSKNCGGRLFSVYKNTIKIGEWYSKQLCAEELNLSDRGILGCLNQPGIFKSHKGYTFQYVGEIHA